MKPFPYFVWVLGFYIGLLIFSGGHVTAQPSIEITTARPDSIFGVVHEIDPDCARVVLWAYTNQYYVQPWTAHPFTPIQSDSTWRNYTHGWDRIIAILVDLQYDAPASPRELHPMLDEHVLAWDEEPPPRIVDFSGYSWFVKYGQLFGPGPNHFSDDPENLWVDGNGLHLRITQRGGEWYCAEVFMPASLGYGQYTFQVDSRVDSLDPRVIFAGFTYESLDREIDIEFTRGLDMIPPNNAQYVIQPYGLPGHRMQFQMPPVAESSHRFVWSQQRVDWVSWTGFGSGPSDETLIAQFTYSGTDVPPDNIERMRFNLWLDSGLPPAYGLPVEVVVRSFAYAPISRPVHVTAYVVDDDILLRWERDQNSYYRIYIDDIVEGYYSTLVGSTSDTVYTHMGGADFVRKYYRVVGSTEP